MGKLHYRESPSEHEKKVFAKYLAEDEELILATGLGKAYLRSQFLLAVMWPGSFLMLLGLGLSYLLKYNFGWGLLGGLILAFIIGYFKALHVHHSNRYLLTTRRVIVKKGVFTVEVASALFDKVTHIEVEQPFLDKVIYHHGTIIINTAGMNKGEITLRYIEHPLEFKSILEKLINRERERYGLGPAPLITVEGEVVDN